MTDTFTAFGLEFNWLYMLNKLLDGFWVGMGFIMAFLVFWLLVALNKKPKPKRTKIRVKLIRP